MRSGVAWAAAPLGDLFGSPPLPGLHYADEIIDVAEEAVLIERIGAAGLTPFQFQQWEGKRLTRSFGWTYDFQTGRFAPSEPIPEWLEPVRDRAAIFAGVAPGDLVQALVIEYGVGAGSAGTRTAPSSSMSWVFRWEPKRRCAFGGGRVRASRGWRCRSRRGRSIIWTARCGPIGSTALPTCLRRAGR